MTPKVIKADKFKASSVQFSDSVKVNKYGGKTVYANYAGGPLRVQLPKMKLPFGVSKFQNPDKPEEVKYSLEMSFANTPKNVLDELLEMEKKIISYAEEKSKELFKKQQSKELLKEFYKSFVKFTENEDGERDEKYAPRLKTKIYNEGNIFKVDAFDSEKDSNGRYPKISITEEDVDEIIQKGSECEAIIECTGIWVVNKSFGVSWKLSQLKIYKNDNKLTGYAFEDEPEEELTELHHDEEEYNEDLGGLEINHREPSPDLEQIPEPEVKVKAKGRKKREIDI
jgi:hypothetical protein